MGCKLCKYIFRRKTVRYNDENVEEIELVDVKTEQQVAFIYFTDGPKKITIEYIMDHHIKQGFGDRLIRAVKAIARGSNKPIEGAITKKVVDFFKSHGFSCIKLFGEWGIEKYGVKWTPPSPVPKHKVIFKVTNLSPKRKVYKEGRRNRGTNRRMK